MKVMAGTNFRYHFMEGTSLWRLLTVITLHLIRVYSQGMALQDFCNLKKMLHKIYVAVSNGAPKK